MAAHRRVDDSRHLQADCKEPESAPEPCDRQSSMSCLYLFIASKHTKTYKRTNVKLAKSCNVVFRNGPFSRCASLSHCRTLCTFFRKIKYSLDIIKYLIVYVIIYLCLCIKI